MKDLKITTRKTGAGHFRISVFDNEKLEEIGNFETTDGQLVDDIEELNDGFESHLQWHETFDQIIKTCLKKMKK